MPKRNKNQTETGAEKPQEGASNAPETTNEKQMFNGKTLREWCAVCGVTDEEVISRAEAINDTDPNGLRVFPDGNAWVAIGPEHKELPEDKVAFGQTPDEAIKFDNDDVPERQTPEEFAEMQKPPAETDAENTFVPEQVYIKVEFPNIPGREDLLQHLNENGALGDEETPEGETDSLFYWVHLEKGLGTVMQLHLETIGAQPQMITEDKSPSLLDIAGGAAEPLPLDVVLMLAEQQRFYRGEPGRRPILEKVTNEGDRTIGTFDLENPSVLTIEFVPRANQVYGAEGETRRLAEELRRAKAELKAAEEKRDQSQGIILAQVDINKYLSMSDEAKELFGLATLAPDLNQCIEICVQLEGIAAEAEDKTHSRYVEPTADDIKNRANRLAVAIQSVKPVMEELERDLANVTEAGKRVKAFQNKIKAIKQDAVSHPVVYCFDLAEPRNYWID